MSYVFLSNKKSNKFTQAMKNYAIDKFEKLESYLKKDEPIKLSLETIKGMSTLKVQVVQKDNKHIRASVSGEDYYELVTQLRDKVKSQFRSRNKKKQGAPVEEAVVEEPKIVKTKHFDLEPISPGMAITEMEKLGHEQYLFKNLEDKICMVYKRIDGDYSLIIVD